MTNTCQDVMGETFTNQNKANLTLVAAGVLSAGYGVYAISTGATGQNKEENKGSLASGALALAGGAALAGMGVKGILRNHNMSGQPDTPHGDALAAQRAANASQGELQL